jgi:hypothetical protein
MKIIKSGMLIILILVLRQNAQGQGFVNLDFENATVILDGGPANIDASSAIPGWTAYAPLIQPVIAYDSTSLGGAMVALEDANAPSGGGPLPIQGNYSMLLQGSTGPTAAASIGQTGQIPLNALSLTFFLSLNSSLQVTFNGQIIPLVQIGSTSNYDIMGGNVSAFSGQTGQLLFTALPNGGYGLLDNIQFSPLAVPEPSELALGALGTLLLAFRRWRNSSR